MLCLAASSAGAEPYRPKTLPECEVYPLADTREVCGWVVKQADGSETLGDWQLVLRADAELIALREQNRLGAEREKELGAQVGDLRAALEVCGKSVDLARDRVAGLTAEYIAKDKQLQDERVKPRVGGKLGWTVAAVLAAGLVGYIGADRL